MMIILYNSIKFRISLFNATPRTSPLQYETIFKLNSPLGGIFRFFLSFNLAVHEREEFLFSSVPASSQKQLASSKKLRSAHGQ